ncbi:MAG: YjbQ family protein [Anaerolineales bacterium]|nr:YjbQ family protein [Anaerolineales bacterium]
MPVTSMHLNIETNGNAEVHDITNAVQQAVNDSNLANGTITVFAPSATSALTTLEFESGCVRDFQRLFDEIADPERHYAHNARWGDGNGHSHIRAALLGPSLTIPFINHSLTLGTWQKIVYVDFDNRQRSRSLVLQLIGE